MPGIRSDANTPQPDREYISDEAHLLPLPPDAPDLHELNASLDALSSVFPDIQIDVFREMLSSFDGESRLALVANALIQNKVTWVKGRWRAAEKEKMPRHVPATAEPGPGPLPVVSVPSRHKFRSKEYRSAVERLAWQEFKGLSRSTITAVLAENNYWYPDARPTLVSLSSKSWRFAISSLFLRRKSVSGTEAATHPLVIWKSSGRGSIVPCIKTTCNAELDKELYEALIVPILQQARQEREDKDHTLAAELNTQEAEELESMFECSCCFTEATFEELVACNIDGHTICFRCVHHTLSEAVFGQGWQSTINTETGTLRCPAVEGSGCKGCISQEQMHRAMLEFKKGAGIMHKFEQRLAEHSLVTSGLPLARCPFCSYAEVNEIYEPPNPLTHHSPRKSAFQLIFVVLCIGFMPFILPLVVIIAIITVLLSYKQDIAIPLSKEYHAARQRLHRRRRGSKFTCRNPECQRNSCLSCNKEWIDIHVCNESSLVALRTQVEQAMSMAVKRVCPRCNTSFVKTAGCNKLTCPCGYKMCYVCRKDIGGDGDGPDVGYRHFCDHFRPEGDGSKCDKCTKCNLWEAENTELVLKQAKEEAERKWFETENRELTGAEKVFLETGMAIDPNAAARMDKMYANGSWRVPTLAEFLDFMVEYVLEA
ncbi:hypothetical protein B0H65DRAFT_324163 [Neurospora tetraspora]|uniref:RING-type domain-containing protein n=1 Tax=Neurospora tetraspora TaxID=94610 RepID=A0AAE0J7P9_9PEZI|nr:hypothetical protein B0H65DRAFT_324163 [Neurospora tetraspora]